MYLFKLLNPTHHFTVSIIVHSADVLKMVRTAKFYSSMDYVCVYFTVHEAVVIGREILDAEVKVSALIVQST